MDIKLRGRLTVGFGTLTPAMKVRYLPPQKKNMCGGSGMDLTRQVVALKIVGSIPTRHPKLNRRIYERSLPHV